MGYKSDGTIQAPVSISDVQAVLGITETTLDYICQSSAVNRWSRFKPIEYKSITPDRTKFTWAKGTKGHCGWSYGYATAVSNVKALYSLSNNGWTAEDLPITYYRLADFANYWHNAKPPVSGFTCTSKVSATGYIQAACSYNIQMAVNDATDPGSVNFSDMDAYYDGELVDLSKMYFGIIVYQGDTLKGIRTSESTGTYDLSVLASSFSMVKGTTYTVYPVMSSVMYTSAKDIHSAGLYVSFPTVSPVSCVCTDAATAAGLTFSVTASYTYDSSNVATGITVTIKLTSTGSTISLTKNYVSFRFSTNSSSDTLESGETQIDLGSLSVTTTTKTIIKSFTSSSGFKATKTYHVIVTLNSGAYSRDITPMQQMITA